MIFSNIPLRVVLTLRASQAKNYDEQRDSISHDWISKLVDWNWTPLLIPNLLKNPVEYLDSLKPDLLLLTGGESLGQNLKRDETEIALLKHAIVTQLPIFGVCRGFQLINKYFKGTNTQVDGHIANDHNVTFTGVGEKVYGSKQKVNSFHSLGTKPNNLGHGVIPIAYDQNGWIEGFCQPQQNIAAVMWHPERNGAPNGDKILVESLCKQKL